MKKSTKKKWESFGHGLGAWAATLVNLQYLWIRREIKQLPPENDKHPVVWVQPAGSKDWDWVKAYLGDAYGGLEYWAKARVMDTLNDIREYFIGITLAWPFVFGAGVWVGWYFL